MTPFFLPVAGVIDAFWASTLAGKLIVLLLFAGSIFVWSVLVTKWRQLRAAQRITRQFIKAYRKEGAPAGLFMKRQRYEPCPAYAVYDSVCKALGAELGARGADPDDLFLGSMSTEQRLLTKTQIAAVRSAARVALCEANLLLESRMSFLAIAAKAALLAGLAGMTLGLLDVFCGIRSPNPAGLSDVAPGISGALLTMVVGLLVALPSLIGHSMLAEQIRRLRISSDSFVEELLSDAEHKYLEQGKELASWGAKDVGKD